MWVSNVTVSIRGTISSRPLSSVCCVPTGRAGSAGNSLCRQRTSTWWVLKLWTCWTSCYVTTTNRDWLPQRPWSTRTSVSRTHTSKHSAHVAYTLSLLGFSRICSTSLTYVWWWHKVNSNCYDVVMKSGKCSIKCIFLLGFEDDIKSK